MRFTLGSVLIFLSPVLFAAPVACVPGTLQDYIDLGSDGCQLSDKVVSDFTLLTIPNTATEIPASSILIAPDPTAYSPGLVFSSTLAAPAGTFLDTRFAYLVTSPLPIVGLRMALDGASASGDGVVTVIKDTCVGEGFVFDLCLASPGDSLITLVTGSDSVLLAATAFDPPVFILGVAEDIGIDGGLLGQASFGSVSNTFLQTPEPSTALCLLLGLLFVHRLRPSAKRRSS